MFPSGNNEFLVCLDLHFENSFLDSKLLCIDASSQVTSAAGQLYRRTVLRLFNRVSPEECQEDKF